MARKLHCDFINLPSLTGHAAFTGVPETPVFNFTRATAAWDTDADGYIRKYQSGEARFTGATFNHNLIDYSNTFDNDAWAKSNATVTSGQADPDGGSTAYSLNSDATASAVHRLQNAQTVPKAGTYRFSCYAKASGLDWIYLSTQNFGSPPGNIVQYYDLANGVTGSADADADAIGIVDVGGGWYRCWFEVTVTEADLAGTFFISPAPSDGTATYNGTSSEDAVIWRAQLERVTTSGAPGTYVDTAATAVSSLSGTSTKGLLVEEARTNICLQSEDFDTTWAAEADAVVTTNQTTAPDGSTTADKIADDGISGGGSTCSVQQSLTLSTSTAYTYSVFAKADQLDWAFIDVVNMGVLVTEQYFDLTNGVVGTPGANVTSSGIEDYGNGWYRCWMTFTSDSSDTSVAVRVMPAETDGDNTVARDGTSSIFVWGAMVEAGSTMSSYIPTTTGTVTRNAETDINTTDVSWYAETGGTLYVKARQIADVTAGVIARINNGGDTNYIEFTQNSGTVRFKTAHSTDTDSNIEGDNVAPGTEWQGASAFADDDIAFYQDGAQKGTDTDAAIPLNTAVADLHIGATVNDISQFNGHIAEIAYWDERLDNDTLDGLSAGTISVESAGAGLLRRRREAHIRRQVARKLGMRETWGGRRYR